MSFGRAFTLAAVVLGVIAIVLGVICSVSVVRTRTFLDDSATASGRVVGLVPRESCDQDDSGRDRNCTTVYAPRVEFTTADGRELVFVSDTASSPPDHAEGDVVEVRYLPDDPSDARIDSVTGIWLGAMVTGGLSLLFAGFTVLWIVLAVRFRHA